MPTFEEAKSRYKPEYSKKPGELEPEGINDVVFSGTGLRYLTERLKESGGYSHEKGKKVYFANKLGGAYGAAVSRSRAYHDEPVIIVVDTTYIDPSFNLTRRGNNNDIVCDQVPRGAIIGIYKVGKISSVDFLVEEVDSKKDPIQFLKEKGEEVILDV